MLDECKGERLEEVLAVFSNAVLKRTLQNGPFNSIAQQLAFENLSYSGDHLVGLSSLILAHKGSIQKHLRQRESSRALYRDFSGLLDLQERRITRRHEFVKELKVERELVDEGAFSSDQSRALAEAVKKSWIGQDEWLETLLYGDSRVRKDGLLATPFEKVWKHVEAGSIGEIEGKHNVSLSEQLDERVRAQESRLSRWQEFGRSLSIAGATSPAAEKQASTPDERIDLNFTLHQSLQVSGNTEKTVAGLLALDEYSRMVVNMTNELARVGKPQPRRSQPIRQSFGPQTQSMSPDPAEDVLSTNDEEWSSVSETAEPLPGLDNHLTKTPPQKPQSDAIALEIPYEKSQNPPLLATEEAPSSQRITSFSVPTREIAQKEVKVGHIQERAGSPQQSAARVSAPSLQSTEPDSDLADHILQSVSASSPSPKKPRHTLSLAERTRLSMSRVSHSKYSDLHDNVDDLADLTDLSIRTKSSQPIASQIEPDGEMHADLIERTRKSMAGFEAAQRKAQIERRRSMKDARKKQRESSYFPKVDEEPVIATINPEELIDGDPDYESVFKSRPKIKTSPAASPTRTIMEDEIED